MNIIEDFFKNRVSFTSLQAVGIDVHAFLSTCNQIFNPEDYSLDFLKEKTKSLCHYLHSDSDRCFTEIGFSSETSMGFSIFPIYEVKLDCMRDCLKEFEKRFTYWFERTKTLIYYLEIPNKTFRIVIMTRKISEVQPSMWEVNSDEFTKTVRKKKNQ